MRNAYNFTFEGGVLTPTPVLAPEVSDITSMLEVCHGDATNPKFVEMATQYVAFDPKNIIIERWLSQGHSLVMEEEHPWLATYRGVDAEEPPEHDMPARSSTVAAAVVDYKRRKFKAERYRAMMKLTVEENGKVFDGDEESQTRMSRAVTVAQMVLLDVMQDALTTVSQSPDATAAQLAGALAGAMTAARQLLATPWALADNTVTTTDASELAGVMHKAMVKQSEVWFETP